jgi:parallel beta-helix repeat protein
MKGIVCGRSFQVLIGTAGLLFIVHASAIGAAQGPDSVTILPVPNDIQNGAIVTLECGRIYQGSLNLVGKSHITVKTEGSCGKASISPGSAVTGWTRYQDKIYSAAVPFTPEQVAISGKPMARAHFPNKPQIWAKGKSDNPYKLQYAMPNADLAGALLVYRPEDWLIETRPIKEYADGSMTLAPKVGDAFDPKPVTDFYVEGKLWMLDIPGEWAISKGRLYVWTPDGQSPEGRVWAAPKASGIDATDSRNVTIDGVRVFSASIGIDGSNSSDLHVLNSEIINSAEDGIFAGGNGLLVHNTSITNSVHNGILGDYGITGSVVTNSTVTATGTFGMPKRSKGGIVFEEASGQRVANNKVFNSSYIAIRVHKNAIVSGNTIDGACLILTDCGGIYTFAPDKQALNVRIEGNTIKNLAQRQAYGVYLDDNANQVVVTRNIISNNPGGIELHNGFDNTITHNVFSSSGFEHILFNETGTSASVRYNRITDNTFVSTRGEATYRLWSVFGGATVEQFGHFDDNTYTTASGGFAEVAGTGMLSFSAWKTRMKEGRSMLKSTTPNQRDQMVKTTFATMLEKFISVGSWVEAAAR